MPLVGSVGSAQALGGREAGLQATHQALNQIGVFSPNFGIVIASHQYQPREVLSGVSSLLGESPVIGFSSPAGLTGDGHQPHSVVVALLGGDFDVQTEWHPEFAQSGRETALKIMEQARANGQPKSVLCFADGFNGDAEQFCSTILNQSNPLVGALSSGDMNTGTTFQLAGNQTGVGGLAAAFLQGGFRMSVGYAHGWDPIGRQFRVTRSRGFWLRTLDGRPASETYAEIFGYPARDWAFPPLNHLARLYPLGVEQGEEMIIRSPIRVEADGSFRMNAAIRDGIDAYLLVGSRNSCENAARRAAQQALQGLEDARPALAIVLVDIAWQMLLKANPGIEIAAIQDILGTQLPIAGGYTLGQIVPIQDASPKLLNQHITVILFGEAAE
jgi:hypothetical protein